MTNACVYVLLRVEGFVTLRDRAVPGISCIKPMAPFLETALGLKFDSTLTTERTKLGSTLCLTADCVIAASICSAVKALLLS